MNIPNHEIKRWYKLAKDACGGKYSAEELMDRIGEYLTNESPYWSALKYDTAVCSHCGGDINTGFDSSEEARVQWHTLYPFCPHCGAQMTRSEYNG